MTPAPRPARAMVLIALTALVVLARSVAAAEPVVVELTLTGGELHADRRVLRVRHGDDVTLRWTTDRPLTLHLHGYDVETTLSPGKPGSMRFTARATGRFAIESHAQGGGNGFFSTPLFHATVELPTIGLWQVTVSIAGSAGSGDVTFDVDVAPALAIRWAVLATAGITLLVAVAVWRLRRRHAPGAHPERPNGSGDDHSKGVPCR